MEKTSPISALQISCINRSFTEDLSFSEKYRLMFKSFISFVGTDEMTFCQLHMQIGAMNCLNS